jgi:hypothetical protein
MRPWQNGIAALSVTKSYSRGKRNPGLEYCSEPAFRISIPEGRLVSTKSICPKPMGAE